MELTEQEEALLVCAVEDWSSLAEFGHEFVIRNSAGAGRWHEIRGPTKATLLSLLANGLVQFAYVTHHGLPKRMLGPHQPPDVRDIPNEDVDDVLNDPANWEPRAHNEENLEFSATPKGVEVLHQLWRSRSQDSN